jgi:hypothetical protein
VDPNIARRTWRTLEPIHGMIYFVEEGPAAYRTVGIEHPRTGYFASRSAALGPAPAEVVIATFYNFCPDLVRRCIPAAWEKARPSEVLAARLDAADRALTRLLGPDALVSPEMLEAARLARRAAAEAAGDLAGRPLFAAHAALDWPSAPHLVLWHAQTLLREYRGDGHIAVLVSHGLGPLEALVTHAAAGDVDPAILRATRAWPEAEWEAAAARLADAGVIGPDGALTDTGRALRQAVEDETDVRAVRPYAALGEEGCARLRALGRPFSRAVVDGGGLGAGRTFLFPEEDIG